MRHQYEFSTVLLALCFAAAMGAGCGSGSDSELLGDPGGQADQCCIDHVGGSSYCQCTSSGAPPCGCHGGSIVCSVSAGTCGGQPPAGPTPTPGPGPTPPPGPVAGARVFIELESPGFGLVGFPGLPLNLGKHFASGAILYPYDGLDQVKNAAAWTEGCAKLAAVGVAVCEHWVGLYLGDDAGGHLADCNAQMVTYPSTGGAVTKTNPNASIDNCAAGIETVYKQFTDAKLQVDGFSVDNEGTTPAIFAPALDRVRLAHSGLQLGSTRTIQDMNNDRPHGGQSGAAWDYSFGQFYTIGSPTNLYENTCNLRPGFWQYVQDHYGDLTPSPGPAFWSSYRVPMLCGAGDCQDCVDVIGCKPGGHCLDNRLEPKEIADLLDNRPANFPLENFAIWYGVTPKKGALCCNAQVVGTSQCVDGPWVATSCP